MIYKNCEMIGFYYDSVADDHLCNVLLDEKKIRVEYGLDGQAYAYEGENKGTGHFFLTLKEGPGEGIASLHFERDNKTMVGWWLEDGVEGLWKVTLKNG